MIAIIGEFQYTGPRMVRAIQRAQAVTEGTRKQKEAAGLGVLIKHLGDRAPGSLATTLARACLSGKALAEAGELFEGMETKQRKAFLLKLLTPHFVSRSTLFGTPIGEATEAEQSIEAGKLAELLEPSLPKQELILVANSTAGEGKLISPDQITNRQYAIFREQTGHRAPYQGGRHNEAVVTVDYSTDVVSFASWQGMRAPNEEEFLAARKANILRVNRPWEWLSNNEGGLQVYRAGRDYRGRVRPTHRSFRKLSFRVAQG